MRARLLGSNGRDSSVHVIVRVQRTHSLCLGIEQTCLQTTVLRQANDAIAASTAALHHYQTIASLMQLNVQVGARSMRLSDEVDRLRQLMRNAGLDYRPAAPATAPPQPPAVPPSSPSQPPAVPESALPQPPSPPGSPAYM